MKNPRIDTVNLVGKDGVTFTPKIDSRGILTWSNNGGLPNPKPLLIKGENAKEQEVIIQLNPNFFSEKYGKSQVLVQKIGNMVYVNGSGTCSKSLSEWDVLFTLPEGMRVTSNTTRYFGQNTREMGVFLKPDGTVSFYSGNAYTNSSFDLTFSFNILDNK